jgi:hypothetical protein
LHSFKGRHELKGVLGLWLKNISESIANGDRKDKKQHRTGPENPPFNKLDLRDQD